MIHKKFNATLVIPVAAIFILPLFLGMIAGLSTPVSIENTVNARSTILPYSVLTNTVDIAPGASYVLNMGLNGNNTVEQPVVDDREVLASLPTGSAEILAAVDRSPLWLRDDLMVKFLEL